MLQKLNVLPLLGIVLGLASCGQSPTVVGSASAEKAKSVPPPVVSAAPAPAESALAVVAAPEKPCGMPKSLPKSDWPKKLEPTSPTEPAAYVAGAATIAVLPDTQYYVDCRSAHFRKQVEWLMAQRSSRNIRAAVTLGDLTEHNEKPEWEFYKESLKGLDPTFPFLLNLGNHDYGDAGSANSRKTFFWDYFDPKFVEQTKTLIETLEPGKLENAFYSIDLGKVAVGVLILEWSPRKKTVDWANAIIKKHPKHRIMMATHAYLYSDSTRYDFKKRGTAQEWNPLAYPTAKGEGAADGNHDGEMLWHAVFKKYPNVFLTVNGHVLNNGTGLLTSKGDKGNTVHQILVNYQMLDEGGLGYLRLLEFQPDGKTLRVKTYSPSLNVYATGKENDFTLTIDPPLWAGK
jgi:hypothetical protein